MSIQWFPGHMAKARRLLLEQLRWVDAVIELGDARLPESSLNPMLREMLAGKPKLLVLNKSDLADNTWTERWLERLGQEGLVFPVSATAGSGVGRIIPQLESLVRGKQEQLAARGVRARPLRVMVVGIPNIGKSSLINQLTGGARAKTGNKPGVTRGNQWVRINPRVELLDTPGLLWPKFDDPEAGRKLAAAGSIKDEVVDSEELALWLIEWLQENYPASLERYRRGQEKLSLEDIGRARGCLVQGGRVDTLKAAQIFFKEFRAGLLGKVTMDKF
ncbi:ribosome biogenesis GTPase YlqF [Paradesulfitobacterium aromaticivorans]